MPEISLEKIFYKKFKILKIIKSDFLRARFLYQSKNKKIKNNLKRKYIYINQEKIKVNFKFQLRKTSYFSFFSSISGLNCCRKILMFKKKEKKSLFNLLNREKYINLYKNCNNLFIELRKFFLEKYLTEIFIWQNFFIKINNLGGKFFLEKRNSKNKGSSQFFEKFNKKIEKELKEIFNIFFKKKKNFQNYTNLNGIKFFPKNIFFHTNRIFFHFLNKFEEFFFFHKRYLYFFYNKRILIREFFSFFLFLKIWVKKKTTNSVLYEKEILLKKFSFFIQKLEEIMKPEFEGGEFFLYPTFRSN